MWDGQAGVFGGRGIAGSPGGVREEKDGYKGREVEDDEG